MIMSLISLSSANYSHADSIEKLLMPGELIKGHAKYEDSCSQCHQPLGKVTQTTLCLDCHKEVRKDIDDKRGFHGKNQGVENNECKSCHTDHKGRGANIVLLNPHELNHTAHTDFELKDSHKTVACDDCHRPNKKFREAKHECIDCHKDDDVHKKELGTDCKDCHSEKSWTKTGFDHNKTKFKLKGKHKEADCLGCHVTETYTDAPTQCYACHKVNDVHNKTLGTDCKDCHNEAKWKDIRFDHDKTDYPLTGEHKQAACNSCHTTRSLKEKLPKDCIGCHRQDDTHSGRNGEKCKSCHTTKSWKKNKFNHNKTDFPLKGHHKELLCTNCHKGDVYKDDLPTTCFDCHKQDDVHQKSQGEACSNCHNETDWQAKILFDHDVTHFPLVGLHASVSCDDCHASGNFKQTDTSCISCHKEDDIHKNTLGENCQQCHTPNSWSFWLFDHDEQTKYPLKGKHSGLVCDACHTKPSVNNKLEISDECNDCHHKDDIHRGNFGRDCGLCHDTESFENFTFKKSH